MMMQCIYAVLMNLHGLLTIQGQQRSEEVRLEKCLGKHLKNHHSYVQEQHPFVATISLTKLYKFRKYTVSIIRYLTSRSKEFNRQSRIENFRGLIYH